MITCLRVISASSILATSRFLTKPASLGSRKMTELPVAPILAVQNSRSERTKVVTNSKSNKLAKVKTAFEATQFLGKFVRFVP